MGSKNIDGRRMDPAGMQHAAGAPRYMTAHMMNAEEVPEKFQGGKKLSEATRNVRMTIEMVPHKKIFDQPERNVISHHNGVPATPLKPQRRQGYQVRATDRTFTWNECGETGFSPKFPVRTGAKGDFQYKSDAKTHTSCKGEKLYNICGTEDLRPTGTSDFIKSEVPPSARHVYENNRKELCNFEFNAITPRVDPMLESTAMWGCLNWAGRRQYEPPEEALGYMPSNVPPSTMDSQMSEYEYYTDSRPDGPPPATGDTESEFVDYGSEAILPQRQLKRSASVPSSSRKSTITGGSTPGSRLSRASSTSSLARSRAQRAGSTPAARWTGSRASRPGTPARFSTGRISDSPARPGCRI